MFLFALKLHTNVVQSMMRIQQAQQAVEIQAAVTIHQNLHDPDVVAADAVQHLLQVVTLRHHHQYQHLRKHVVQIRDSEKIVK